MSYDRNTTRHPGVRGISHIPGLGHSHGVHDHPAELDAMQDLWRVAH